jgi:hypothetical protein
MKIRNPPGAQFEILVDGKPRSYRYIKAVAIESAEFLKSRHPHSEVAVKLADWRGDRSSQGVGRLDGAHHAPDRPWPRRLQGQHRLQHLQRRVEYRPHLRNARRSLLSAKQLSFAVIRLMAH